MTNWIARASSVAFPAPPLLVGHLLLDLLMILVLNLFLLGSVVIGDFFVFSMIVEYGNFFIAVHCSFNVIFPSPSVSMDLNSCLYSSILFPLDSSNSRQFVISVSTVKSGIYSCIVLQVVMTAIKNHINMQMSMV